MSNIWALAILTNVSYPMLSYDTVHYRFNVTHIQHKLKFFPYGKCKYILPFIVIMVNMMIIMTQVQYYLSTCPEDFRSNTQNDRVARLKFDSWSFKM
jgi:hypothetical protein